MKKIIRVTYVKNAVKYSTVLPDMPDSSIEQAMLKKQVGRSQIFKKERELVPS